MKTFILAALLCGCVTGGQVQRAQQDDLQCWQSLRSKSLADEHFAIDLRAAWDQANECMISFIAALDAHDKTAPETHLVCLAWKANAEGLSERMHQEEQANVSLQNACEQMDLHAGQLAETNRRQADAWQAFGDGMARSRPTQVSCTSRTSFGTTYTNCQ